jgi:hypothetical protein
MRDSTHSRLRTHLIIAVPHPSGVCAARRWHGFLTTVWEWLDPSGGTNGQ